MAKVARLLDALVPEKYRLKFDINMDKFIFEVQEELDHDPTIKMHDLAADEQNQSVALKFADEIPAGKHTLAIGFSGKIEEVLHGLYRSNYMHEGKQKSLVVTDLEPVAA